MYGIHSSLVEEVIEFTKSGPLLKPTQVPILENLITLNSLEGATRMAWFAENVHNSPTDSLTWTDLREKDMSTVLGASYRKEGFSEIRNNFHGLLEILFSHLKSRLKGPTRILIDDILGDLHGCAKSRGVFGRTDDLHENMFEIYKLGGWPCGWEGEYPQGKLCAYFPRLENQ